MLSRNARYFNRFLKYMIKPGQAFIPIHPGVIRVAKRLTDALMKWMKPPTHASIESVDAGGVAGEWVVSGDDVDPDKVILYLHGGGYFLCSPATHRPITCRLSWETGIRVLSLDYRLLPEHTLADCREDAISAYCWLLDQGIANKNIMIGGDSAGGGLTLLTLLALKNRKIPLPRAAFCLSPLTDMSRTSPSFVSNARKSDMFHKNMIMKAEAYIARGKDPYDPDISPAFGDYSGLPPLFIQVSDSELLYHDSLLAAENARKAGVEVELNVWHNLPHVFPVLAAFLPEGKKAVKQIAAFVNKRFGKCGTVTI